MISALKVKFLNNKAQTPTKGSEQAAGYDLYAAFEREDEILIPSGETRKVGTGIAIELPENHFGAIFARSGLATRQGLRPSNCVGIIDPDYRGEIIVALYNDSERVQEVKNGERIAQLVIIPFVNLNKIEEVSELSDTVRGSDGFGSTGK